MRPLRRLCAAHGADHSRVNDHNVNEPGRLTMRLTFGSLFAGIGGFDLGFERAGMCGLWQVEIYDKARSVLERHFTETVRHEDVREVGRHNLQRVDAICGGFPCQDLSIAGERAGLDGERSGLWFEFARIIEELTPEWVVIENVPGLLSSNRGADFAVILQGLVKCGYGVAWRVLDSQYFGVPQRRRRVFIVGHLGDGRAAEVLFESECLPGNSETGRKTRKKASGSTGATAYGGGNRGEITVATTRATRIRYAFEDETFIIFDQQQITSKTNCSQPKSRYSPTLIQAAQMMVASGGGVRRLTPTECERLQGFPDGWTDGQSDSARYRQLGNAVTVNVAQWIGQRIIRVRQDD